MCGQNYFINDNITYLLAVLFVCMYVCNKSIFFRHHRRSYYILRHVDNPFGSTINIVSSVTMRQNHPPTVHCFHRLSPSGLKKLSYSFISSLSHTHTFFQEYTRTDIKRSVFTAVVVLEVYYYHHTSTAE